MATRGWLKFALRRVLPALAVLALLLASLKLAEDAAGGGGVGQYYRWILAAAAAALAILALAIAQRLWRLRVDLHSDAPGARLGRRLLVMLVLLAVPPVVVVYGFALRFLDATIDNWFNVKLEQALDNALEIGRIVVDERLRMAEKSTVDISARLDATPANELQAHSRRRDRRARRDAADRVRRRRPRHRDGELRSALSRSAAARCDDADARAGQRPLRRGRTDRRHADAARRGAGRQRRAGQPAPAAGTVSAADAAADADARHRERELRFPAPEIPARFAEADVRADPDVRAAAVGAAGHAGRVRRRAPARRAGRTADRGDARGRRRPLRHAAADREQRRARLPRQLVRADDARDRACERARAATARRKPSSQRAWLVALLERLSAGVLGFDHEGRLRIANRAAEAILGVSAASYLGRSLERARARPAAISPHSPSRWRGIFAAACANGARSSSSTPPADAAC